MNLWIVFIFSIISMLNFAYNRGLTESQNWKYIKKELDKLNHGLKRSTYWKSEYYKDLMLYTARIDDYTGACIQPIFYCYYEEIKVVLEEISMSEEDVNKKDVKKLGNTLENMRTYVSLKSELPDGCKKCEEYEEKPFQEFMKSFETLAQKMNAE